MKFNENKWNIKTDRVNYINYKMEKHDLMKETH